jgi:hypothetical protein
VKFQVLTAASMPFEIQRLVVSLKLTNASEVHTVSIFRAMIALMIDRLMESVRTSETSANFNENTRLYIPEGYHI